MGDPWADWLLLRRFAAVVFCDISEELLNECRTIAADLGMVDRCRFVGVFRRTPREDDLAAWGCVTSDAFTTPLAVAAEGAPLMAGPVSPARRASRLCCLSPVSVWV